MQYKYSYKFDRRTLGALTVCNTGVQRCEGGYSWGPGVRDHYLLHYIISGRGSFCVGEKTYELQAGDLFFARPNECISYTADERDPWEYCWVGFFGTEARVLLDQTDLTEGVNVLHGVDKEAYEEMMQIYERRGSLPHQSVSMSGALYELMAVLMRSRKSAAAQVEHDTVRRACDFISNNFAMPISIADIADHVGLSRSQLYRTFMEELNVPPVQVLTQVRIRQACALLRRGGLSIKTVAASVGFENQMYFSRRFRDIMGMSPTEYLCEQY